MQFAKFESFYHWSGYATYKQKYENDSTITSWILIFQFFFAEINFNHSLLHGEYNLKKK